ncbi:MAG: hypothetical protein HC842_08680, partial [Cytophagales bacterium]|nr:hypothetical protein [Cytophagales bacterium]
MLSVALSAGPLLAKGRFVSSFSFAGQFTPPDSVMTADDSLLLRSRQADSIYSKPYKPSKYPRITPKDRQSSTFMEGGKGTPMLPDANIFEEKIELDSSFQYRMKEQVDGRDYRPGMRMSLEEFTDWQEREMIKNYWQSKSEGLDGEGAVGGRRLIPLIPISPVFDRVFGGSYVDITPTGFVTLDFGGRWQNVQNPATSVDRQQVGTFDFNQQINMNVVGKVGEKLKVNINYDNNATFDFENNVK